MESMKVLQVSEGGVLRGRGSDVSIGFLSKEECHVDGIVSIDFMSKPRYFKITEVSADIESDYLKVKAISCGYYDKITNVDIRNLLRYEVTLVTDEEKIQDIREENRLI